MVYENENHFHFQNPPLPGRDSLSRNELWDSGGSWISIRPRFP